jgi:hypothetical protein
MDRVVSLSLAPNTPPIRQNRRTRSYAAAGVAFEVFGAYKLPQHYNVRTPFRVDTIFHWLGNYLLRKKSKRLFSKRSSWFHNLHSDPEKFYKASIDFSALPSNCWFAPNRAGAADYINLIK